MRATTIAIAAAVAAAASSASHDTRPATAGLAPAPSGAPVGYTYTVRVDESGSSTDRYRVSVLGAQARVDGIGRRDGSGARDYLLVYDNGNRVIMVHPDERQYNEVSAEEFESMIGLILRKVDKVLTVKLRDARVSTDRLGAGERLLGMPTQRVRLTQDFTVGVGAFGFTKDVRQRIVTDFWVSPELPLAANPVINLITAAQSALAQQDVDFVRRSRRERLSICPGMPLRMV
ncbi:MAG: hypothetical protein MUE41_08355, partial [Gemmatimonadaceae bacterium]|nr:hypothetical protein [Gemmatimonadaceae bacterium]